MMEQALDTSTRDNPNYDFMAVNLAALWMQTGDNFDAIDLLNRVIAESPEYSRAWANRAVIRYRLGQPAAAQADAEAALRLDHNNRAGAGSGAIAWRLFGFGNETVGIATGKNAAVRNVAKAPSGPQEGKRGRLGQGNGARAKLITIPR